MRSSSLSEFLTYVVSARIGGKGRKGEERGKRGQGIRKEAWEEMDEGGQSQADRRGARRS